MTHAAVYLRVLRRLFPLRSGERMPERFIPLANYNTERARGLLHDAETDRRMTALQANFDEWQAAVTHAAPLKRADA